MNDKAREAQHLWIQTDLTAEYYEYVNQAAKERGLHSGTSFSHMTEEEAEQWVDILTTWRDRAHGKTGCQRRAVG